MTEHIGKYETSENDVVGIGLYECWYRDYQSMLLLWNNERSSSTTTTTTAATATTTTNTQSQQQLVAVNESTRMRIQYEAMIYLLNDKKVTDIDSMNIQILQQQQQQQQLFLNDTLRSNDDGTEDSYNSSETRHTPMIRYPPPPMTTANDHRRYTPPQPTCTNRRSCSTTTVDDFFQTYPNCCRQPTPIFSPPVLVPTPKQYNNSNDTIHHIQHATNQKQDDTDTNCVNNDICLTATEPQQSDSKPPVQRQRRSKKTNQDTAVRYLDDDDDNDVVVAVSHAQTQRRQRVREDDDAYRSRTNENDPYPSNHGSSTTTAAHHHRRRNNPNNDDTTTTTMTVVNPFQTAREVAQTVEFANDDDDDDNDDENIIDNYRTNSQHRQQQQLQQQLSMYRNRPSSNNQPPQPHPQQQQYPPPPPPQLPTTIRNIQNPYQPLPPPPPPVIRESLKRKFQPPHKQRNTTRTTTTTGGGGCVVEVETLPPVDSTTTVGTNRRRTTSKQQQQQLPSQDHHQHNNHAKSTSSSSSFGPTTTNNKNDDNEDELPEELRMYGKELVEKIESEIMEDRGGGITTTFDDIAGLYDQKQTVTEVVCWPMQRPDLFTGLRCAPNGLLLYGPPGTGKTLIGKAIAHESGATFFSISSSSLTSKWIGEGEKLVRVLFAVAAYRQPAVVFIDEIDSLLTQRKADENEASRRMKTEFLIQLDGTGTSGQGRVLVIGATNRPQELDEAARRRFTKRLYIPLPEVADREALIRVLLKTNHHLLSDDDIRTLANETEGFSGADLKALSTDAAMGPIRQLGAKALEVNIDDVPPITYRHFRHALKGMKPSVSPEDLVQYIEWDKTFGTKRAQPNDDSDSDNDDHTAVETPSNNCA